MGRSTIPFLVCTLVVLAGCSVLSPQGPASPTATPSETLSPAPQPATPTDRLPPGVTSDGLVDPWALRSAHDDVLSNTSYTVGFRHTEHYEDGSLRMRRFSTSMVEATTGDVYFDWMESIPAESLGGLGTPPGYVKMWTNGSVTLTAYSPQEGQNRTQFLRGTIKGIYSRSYSDRLYAFLSSLDVSAHRTTVDGAIRYRLRATEATEPTVIAGLADQVTPANVSDVSNVSFTALVTPEGLVRSYHLEYAVTTQEGTIVVSETVYVRALGETTVTRPPWVAVGLNETAEAQ